MSVADGAKQEPPLALGEFWRQPLPPIEFGRIAAQTAKQVISQKVRDAERARQYEEYKDRVGEIVVGTVKRAESYSITVDLGRAEAVIRREEMIPRENLRQGDRVRAYIIDVREEQRGPQIFLSRACNEFMARLFTQEVPGSRVQAVVGELQGEKVEIIPYIEDPASFVVNALAPAEVAKVVMDEVAGRMEVVVPDDQLSLAIGRRGQNVRLASQLSGWYIDILTEAEESERRQEEFRTRSTRFIEALNIDDVIAHLLVAEGFVLPEEIAETPIEELATIQGFDEGIAEELQARAVEFVEREAQRINEALDNLKVADDLRNFEYISLGMMLKLAENEVLSLDDLADLDSDELVALLSEHGLEDDTEAGDIIMAARAHWFDDEPEVGEASDAAEGDAATAAATEAAPEAVSEAASGDEPAAS